MFLLWNLNAWLPEEPKALIKSQYYYRKIIKELFVKIVHYLHKHPQKLNKNSCSFVLFRYGMLQGSSSLNRFSYLSSTGDFMKKVLVATLALRDRYIDSLHWMSVHSKYLLYEISCSLILLGLFRNNLFVSRGAVTFL